MTFAELQRGVFDDLQYQAQPKAGVQDRVRRYLNEGLERVLRRPRLKQLRFGTMPMTSEPSQGFYGLPMVLERIDYIIDTTNGRRLPMRTRDWYRTLDPATLTAGTPSVWIPEGIGPVLRQPRVDPASGNTVISARSGFAGDTTQQVRMRIFDSSAAIELELTANLQGQTWVTIGAAPTLTTPGPATISWLSVNARTTSPVYFCDVANPNGNGGLVGAGAVFALISPWELSSRHLGVRLYPTPSGRIPYELEGQRVIPRMLYDEDEPPFSDDFHEMLQCYARARFYRKDGRLAQAQAEMAEFERFALDLTAHVEYPVEYRPVAGKLSGGHRWSDLGPSYPADRWSDD